MDDYEVKMFKTIKEAEYSGYQFIIPEHYEMDLNVSVNTFGAMQINRLFYLACKMLRKLEKLKDLNIVHGYFKPISIMMVSCLSKSEQFKLINFGHAVQLRNQESLYGYFQTSYYRASELIVDLPTAKSIDMWSLGCTIGELAVSRPMFPGSGDYETVLDNGVRTLLCYNNTINGDGWMLKSPLERGIFPLNSSALHPPIGSLDSIINLMPLVYPTQQDTQNPTNLWQFWIVCLNFHPGSS
ncbi:hypothetical protein ACOME3_000510 [Neoechinorhynchus agilis]